MSEVGQVACDKRANYMAVFKKSWKPGHINISHLAVFNQGYEEPECHNFVGVQEKGSNNEVHALHII